MLGRRHLEKLILYTHVKYSWLSSHLATPPTKSCSVGISDFIAGMNSERRQMTPPIQPTHQPINDVWEILSWPWVILDMYYYVSIVTHLKNGFSLLW